MVIKGIKQKQSTKHIVMSSQVSR